MPEPVPAPTALEIETVADIIREDTATTTSAISDYPATQASSNAKWSLTLDDITTWDDEGFDEVKRVGTIEFFQGSQITELSFVNKIRRRYGFEELTTLSARLTEISSLEWF